MSQIDPREAASALSDIDTIAKRVRQSRFYNLSSLMMVMWGGLVAAGDVASFAWPCQARYVWLAVLACGIVGSFIISAHDRKRAGVRTFSMRALAALLVFVGFGIVWSFGLAQFTPRQLSAFWPSYYMMVYTIVGLWLGWAFVVIGVSVTALTIVGYLFAGAWFDLWMAVVNGGGLILGGLWMRRA